MNKILHYRFSNTIASLLLATLLASMALSVNAAASASAASDGKRPKVCLVLSGGGARGAAHVGVIKVLEEYRIPIDCIAGTSMGALVGAAYASGTSVAEMEKLMGELNTNLLFQDSPPRAELQMRRKVEDYSLLFTPEIGVNSVGGNMLPRGLVSGVQLETVLRAISAPGYLDFDKLPIPYRAVATDLVTGKAVVFDKGELANVMRSSMSVPVAIAPASVNGQILVDGMLVDNLPVDIGRAMGADVIIAVNVGTPLLKREQLDSIGGIAGQMLSILTEQNVQASLALLKSSDILITPELGDFATSDFDHLPSTLPIGEAAARKVATQLSALSLSPEQYALYQKDLPKMAKLDTSPVDKIRFEKMAKVNPEYFQGLMDTQPGKDLNQKELDKDMRKIYGTDDVEHVNYRIVEEDGQRTLVVDAVEKSWGADYVRAGMGLESDFSGKANFTLEGLYRRTWLNSLGAEWITDVRLGQTNRILTEFYQPIDSKHHFFVASNLEFRQTTYDVYSDSDHIATFDTDKYRAGLDFGVDMQQHGQFRLGVRAGVIKPDIDIGPPSLSPVEDNISEGAYTASLRLDKLDSVMFPSSGWFANANLYDSNSSLGADDTYSKWSMTGLYVQSFGKNTFSLFGIANGALDGKIPDYDLNTGGGFLRQSGLASGQLLGESQTYGRLTYYRKLVDYTMFDGLYAGLSLERGKMRDPLITTNSSDWINSTAVFVATDSPLGPLYLGYGHADTGDHSYYLFLGLPY